MNDSRTKLLELDQKKREIEQLIEAQWGILNQVKNIVFVSEC